MRLRLKSLFCSRQCASNLSAARDSQRKGVGTRCAALSSWCGRGGMEDSVFGAHNHKSPALRSTAWAGSRFFHSVDPDPIHSVFDNTRCTEGSTIDECARVLTTDPDRVEVWSRVENARGQSRNDRVVLGLWAHLPRYDPGPRRLDCGDGALLARRVGDLSHQRGSGDRREDRKDGGNKSASRHWASSKRVAVSPCIHRTRAMFSGSCCCSDSYHSCAAAWSWIRLNPRVPK